MKILSWNISWGSKKEKILERLKAEMDATSTIICLQEVTPSTKSFFYNDLAGGKFRFTYSLDFRQPGEFDSQSRKLGVLIITSPDIEITRQGVLQRVPYPDRTAYIQFKYNGVSYTLVNLHSVTGVNYKKGKSVQFDSFAEAIKEIQPDIVTFDANEPKVDHYDIAQMEFFNNGDKGAGAKHFFSALSDTGLTDAYSLFYNKDNYRSGLPLTTSHVLSTGEHRRYDFIFANDKRLDLRGCVYRYADAITATADHAFIVAWSDMELVAIREKEVSSSPCSAASDYTDADLLPFCRFYEPGRPQDKQNLMGFYEFKWMQFMISDKAYISHIVSDYISYNLETFNLSDGVPISLKALLFNRYTHWQTYWTAEGFKEWYLETYLKMKK